MLDGVRGGEPQADRACAAAKPGWKRRAVETDKRHNIKNNINTIINKHNNNVCEQDGERGGRAPAGPRERGRKAGLR